MSTEEYRIQPCENGFLVIDPWGEQLVHTYPTEDAARQDIERCKKDKAMWEAAKLLVDTAIKARMEMFGIDRETASYWINNFPNSISSSPDIASPNRKGSSQYSKFPISAAFTKH